MNLVNPLSFERVVLLILQLVVVFLLLLPHLALVEREYGQAPSDQESLS